MKNPAIACAVLAATLGFSSFASAAPGDRREDRQDRAEQRQDRREARQERREDRREARADRRDDRRDDRRVDRAWNQGYRAGAHQPAYVQSQPRHVYSQPVYRDHGRRFHRGGYLPHEYRQRAYYVNDWHAHRNLYAPPYGHQWVQVGSDFLLVAIATGLIANLLVQ